MGPIYFPVGHLTTLFLDLRDCLQFLHTVYKFLNMF